MRGEKKGDGETNQEHILLLFNNTTSNNSCLYGDGIQLEQILSLYTKASWNSYQDTGNNRLRSWASTLEVPLLFSDTPRYIRKPISYANVCMYAFVLCSRSCIILMRNPPPGEKGWEKGWSPGAAPTATPRYHPYIRVDSQPNWRHGTLDASYASLTNSSWHMTRENMPRTW